MSFARTMKRLSAPLLTATVIYAAARPKARSTLNALHQQLPPNRRAQFHRHFAKLFRARDNSRIAPGVWTSYFAGKAIKLPLTPGRFWLDWDTAISIDGHDIEVKETYQFLLSDSANKPVTFMDIGANYGTHSLIFLAHGVDVVTIEPNPTCHDYFLEACKLNGLSPRLEKVAIGNDHNVLKLSFPEFDTWAGSIELPTAQEASPSIREPLLSAMVPQQRVDDFLPSLKPGPLLIKIDTEGFEEEVIKGSMETLLTKRPYVIFEASPERPRHVIFDLFGSLGYAVTRLPWTGREPPRPLSIAEFVEQSGGNFLAFPADFGRTAP